MGTIVYAVIAEDSDTPEDRCSWVAGIYPTEAAARAAVQAAEERIAAHVAWRDSYSEAWRDEFVVLAEELGRTTISLTTAQSKRLDDAARAKVPTEPPIEPGQNFGVGPMEIGRWYGDSVDGITVFDGEKPR